MLIDRGNWKVYLLGLLISRDRLIRPLLVEWACSFLKEEMDFIWGNGNVASIMG
jgi:membrane-anchored protein YejM (alkaline phosphatase superfamily)